MTMTPKAKSTLAKTIRSLRQELLTQLDRALVGAYRLELSTHQAKLKALPQARRRRLDQWLDSRVAHLPPAKVKEARQRARADVVEQAASTWLNRLVLLRLIEAAGLISRPVLTGGWQSRAYKDFREHAPGLCNDASQGFQTLLELVFGELAQELPGLFGPVGLIELVPMPPELLRLLVEALDDSELASCWEDDLTLGWVYQYWNDPAREELDAKLNARGKVEPHEIASKTQMFTERYMVDWLLQNSLGPMWLAMCAKKGWPPEVQADGTLDRLEARRVEWRAKRDAEEVSLTELMPLHTEAEQRWALYVPQPMAPDAVTQAPDGVRSLQILDPAVGSGHFLVVAFDLLVALYREEARHRGEEGQPQWSDRAIAESILEHNLHGIDLDPRAVQIAAAGLWLKAKAISPEARPGRLNLVASKLELSSLPDDDPTLVELRREVERETGIPAALTEAVIGALRGADHLGSLLKIDEAVDAAIREDEEALGRRKEVNLDLFGRDEPEPEREKLTPDQAKATVIGRLEAFLAAHGSGEDLGLRLRGQQLAAGVRFVRMVREGRYDLVVANPPYQGTSKMVDSKYVRKHYALGKADLYAAFLLRGLELARPGGVSAFLTMRKWMFTKQYANLRRSILGAHALRSIGDFDRGAFESVPDEVVSVSVSVFARDTTNVESVALCPTPRDDVSRDAGRTQRKRAATLCQIGRLSFNVTKLMTVPEWPLIYWWSDELLGEYSSGKLMSQYAPAAEGWSGSSNAMTLRRVWEVVVSTILPNGRWVPYVGGADGAEWIEPLRWVIDWRMRGLAMRVDDGFYFRNESKYFQLGVSFTSVGAKFGARLHRYPSVFGSTGRSIVTGDKAQVLCSLNSSKIRRAIEDLNPTIHFTVGGVNSLPMLTHRNADSIVELINSEFAVHERQREASIEFRQPGPSRWHAAQQWAQSAVDSQPHAPNPVWEPIDDIERPTDHLSFALGVALGRFAPNGDGILDPRTAENSLTLQAGLLFLSAVPGSTTLAHPACDMLRSIWSKGTHRTGKSSLSTWLRADFFKIHLVMYENTPIHWPLSSAKKTFVAWVNIHRMNADTLRILLADHVLPEQRRIEGMIQDLDELRHGADTAQRNRAEKQYARLDRWQQELQQFIDDLRQCAELGPPPPDPKTPGREVDARYAPNLDDGVMINSAALWPLLEPQWKKPKQWWKELATAKAGSKDYDWSHLAKRYWPERVDAKCQRDPSLAVAHGCFWRFHPERAYAWELRLQDEIGPDFLIDEADAAAARVSFLADCPEVVREIREKERKRRKRNAKKKRTSGGLFSAPEAP